MINSWNPILLERNERYEKLVIDSCKKQIRNILKSYVGLFDPFCELLQNAMDAVERQYDIDKGKENKIIIIINMQENSIYVADSGIGFSEDEFHTFLSPNISYKTTDKTRGNKGVGATYLAFGFHKLLVYTKTSLYENFVELKDGRTWVFDDNDEVKMPEVIEIDEQDNDFPFKNGSSFKLFLSGTDGSQITNLAWRGLSTAQAWYYALLTNTPLGHLNINSETPTKILFDIKVINNKGEISEKTNCKADYFYPHSFFESTAQDIDIVLKWQQKQVDQDRDISSIPQKYTRKRIIYKFFMTEELKALALRSKTLTSDEMDLLEEYKIVAYGAFVNSVNRWDDINEKLIKVRRGIKIVSAGLQLATSHMVQGSLLQIPLTSNIGYQKQALIVIHMHNAEPDLGRKGFQPELRMLAEKISSTIVTLGLKRWKKLLAVDDAADSFDQKKKTNYEYIKEMEEYEQSHKLEIINENFFLPSKQISITAMPRSEQDVIVLFSQLIAGGVIRSIELLATSSMNQYDSVYRVNLKPPEDMHYYDIDKNPLGISKDISIEMGRNTSPQFLEYKSNFDELIRDFENEDKSPTEIGLVVVWTMGTKWKDEYQVISTLLPDYVDRRRYHGFTHEVYYDQSGSNRFDCIVLEELIMYLNDPDAYIRRFEGDYQEY
jgi:hypothetical protein